jgi:ABC-type Fe3+ transport system substrate-binding protein
VLMPGSVAIVAGRPDRVAVHAVAAYLLSAAVERKLAESRSANVPLRHPVPGPRGWPTADALPRLEVSVPQAAAALAAMRELVATELRGVR